MGSQGKTLKWYTLTVLLRQRILWALAVGGELGLLALGWFLVTKALPGGAPRFKLLPHYAPYLVAGLGVFVLLLSHGSIVDQLEIRGDQSSGWTRFIVRIVLKESAALFGFVAALLTGQLIWLVLLVLLSFASTLLIWPRLQPGGQAEKEPVR